MMNIKITALGRASFAAEDKKKVSDIQSIAVGVRRVDVDDFF